MARALIRPDTLYAWKGPSLLVVNTRGECGPDPSTSLGASPSTPLGAGQGLSGYYFREARFLSTCRLEINGHPPWLCEGAAIEPDLLEFSYTFPEVTNY